MPRFRRDLAGQIAFGTAIALVAVGLPLGWN
jgi:hypothetical protein